MAMGEIKATITLSTRSAGSIEPKDVMGMLKRNIGSLFEEKRWQIWNVDEINMAYEPWKKGADSDRR